MQARPTRSILRKALLSLAATLAFALPAQANFHLMKVVEVFLGTPAAPNAQYVVLQMYSPGQDQVAGHKITVFNATGTNVGTFTFGSAVAHGNSQDKILIATPEAVAFFGLGADLTMSAAMLSAGGKVCFDAIPVDCLAWGGWTGGTSGVGTPFASGGPFPSGRAAIRRLDISGSPTLLEGTDDTDQCSTDFVQGTPAPRNNAGTLGTIPGATCGNGAIEGLEQCDDHNTANGDSCSSTCQVTVPTATLSIADVAILEGDAGTQNLVFTVTLSQALASPVTYNIATSNGTATAGSDYVAKTLNGETIPAGMTSKTFSVVVNGDTTVELAETFNVTLSGVNGAGVADGTAVGTINNNDQPDLSIADASKVEGNAGTSLLVLTLTLNKVSPVPVTFNISSVDGSATAGSDFVALNLTNQSIAAGALTRTVSVTLNGDTTVEGNEAFTAFVSGVANANIVDGTALATIINDDGPTLSIADVATTEGNSGTKVMTFQAKLSQVSGSDVTFTIGTLNSTATGGSDFVTKGLTGQKILAGQTTYDFAVTLNGDTTVENNELFVVLLSSVTGNVTVADDRATGTIQNDDGPTLSIGDASIAEGDSGTKLLTFVVTLSQAAAGPVTYTAATGNGSGAQGSDFVAKVLNNETIPAGQLSRAFNVTINGDTAIEANETMLVTLSNATGASVLDSQGLGTILNDDGPTLGIGDVELTEGNAGTKLATFTVSLSAAQPGPVSYNITTVNGTAGANVFDYVAKALNGETIAAGQVSRTFQVTINGDTAVEPNETIFVRITSATGATILDNQARGLLINDDGPVLSISDPVAIAEGNSGTKLLTFTVNLAPAAAGPVTYTIGTANGTALAGSDYVASTLTGETIAAGLTSKTFSVTVNGDGTVEPDETVLVNLSASTGATIADAQAVGTLTNDDQPWITVADVSVAEGNTGTKAATFTVQLDELPLAPVTYDIATSNGTATAGSDYVASTLIGQTIPAGVMSKTFAVTLNGDTAVEPNETFTVTVSNVSGASLVDGVATGTLTNDDSASPGMSIDDASVFEGDSGTMTMHFSVNLSQPSASPVTYSIATATGTAGTGDFVARTLTGEAIPAGQLSHDFAVTVNGDTAYETDESFTVTISSVVGATLADATAIGEIFNDDEYVGGYSVSMIQGDGGTSPVAGKHVHTQGVVTGRTAEGFYLQSADAEIDRDSATSEGLFVTALKGQPVAVGQRVEVGGTVREVALGDGTAATQTRLVAEAIKVLAHGQVLPAVVVLTAKQWHAGIAPDALERYEGMRVQLPDVRVVGPSGYDGRFHVVAAGVARPFREPGIAALDNVAPTAGKTPPVFDTNAERLRIDSRGQLGGIALGVDVGDRVRGLAGVLDDGDSGYRVLTDPAAKFAVIAGARPGRAEPEAFDEATIAQLDLGAYLTNGETARLGKAATVLCATLRAPALVAVGAVSATAFERLAAAANATACAPQYRAQRLPNGEGLLVSQQPVAGGAPRATLLGAEKLAVGNRFTHADGTQAALYARTPLRLLVQLHAADGHAFTTAVLLATFAPTQGVNANADPHGWPSHAAALRAQRQAQAIALAQAVQAQQRRAPTQPLAVFGGFQAPEFSEGYAHLLGVLTGRPAAPNRVLQSLPSPVKPALVNLTTTLPAGERYTTTVDGNAQALDHVLVNAALLDAYGARVQPVRVNADFGADNAADTSVPLRVSTHDPLLLRLRAGQ
jgi:cysteine-rich repeat protein